MKPLGSLWFINNLKSPCFITELTNESTYLGDRSEPSEMEPGNGRVKRVRPSEPSQVTRGGDVELGRHRLQPLIVSLFFQQTHCRWVPPERCVSERVHLSDQNPTNHFTILIFMREREREREREITTWYSTGFFAGSGNLLQKAWTVKI